MTGVDRIPTTHAGSLPRPQPLVDALKAVSKREKVDAGELEELTEAAVADAIRRQANVGVDIGNDGEQGRESFFTYVQHRMSGFAEGDRAARGWRDMRDFPDFVAQRRAEMTSQKQVSLNRPPQAVSEVVYGDTTAIKVECERLARLTTHSPFAQTFMTAPSPGIVVAAMANRFYPTDTEYLEAVAAALAVEYRQIISAGFLLQLDAPDLAMECHGSFADKPVDEFLDFVTAVVGAINSATEGLPADRVRLHVCWGNYNGPHNHDLPLAALLPRLYEAKVGGLLLSGANPRHEHEYREFERQPLPPGWTLAAGVIDTTTNYVEHPEVVADRLERVATAVGDPSRIIASTDCGFDTAAGFGVVAPDVAWAKLQAMSDGATLASGRLFG